MDDHRLAQKGSIHEFVHTRLQNNWPPLSGRTVVKRLSSQLASKNSKQKFKKNFFYTCLMSKEVTIMRRLFALSWSCVRRDKKHVSSIYNNRIL